MTLSPSETKPLDAAEFTTNWRQAVEQGFEPAYSFPHLPVRYRSKTLLNFSGYDAEIAKAKAALDLGGSVFISGICGSGKTHLAVGLFRYRLAAMLVFHDDPIRVSFDAFQRARFFPVSEFFVDLKSAMDDHTPEDEILNRYSWPDLIVLDDIGAEKVSDWSRQMFYTLIDRRYRDLKQTIITSNLSLPDLSAKIDDRVGSRITEMCHRIFLKGDKRIDIANAREEKAIPQ